MATSILSLSLVVRRPACVPPLRGVAFFDVHVLRCTPNEPKHNAIGVHMSTVIKRDKKQKGTGKAPPFHMRIVPELKEQFDNEASNDGVSLANWLKELGRKELLRRGIEPKG